MKKTIIISLIIALLVVIGIASSCYTVNEDEYAYVVRFSKVEQVIDSAGLHFKIPFIDSVQYFPKNIQLYDLAPSDVLTSDSKAMSVDSYVLWKISDPMTFYKSLGSITEAQGLFESFSHYFRPRCRLWHQSKDSTKMCCQIYQLALRTPGIWPL